MGGPPPLLSCDEAPSINSGSLHTARNRQDGTPTEQFAPETSVPCSSQGIENTFPERSPEARICKIPCKPNAGTKSPVDKRFVYVF